MFKDHFSSHAAVYARYRPRYPAELFAFLAEQSTGHALAWDCATGNGQAAVGLASYFERVIATDASAEQVRQGEPHPRVEYRVAPAERSGLAEHSIDLIAVAQAFHWFDFEAFFTEVRRVGRPGALLAVWVYEFLATGEPALDEALQRYHDEIVGPYWPPERKWVDDGYRCVPFPFEEIETPTFEIRMEWDLELLVGYLDTWSAAKRYAQEHGTEPLDLILPALQEAWGPADQSRTLVWPIQLRLGRVRPGSE